MADEQNNTENEYPWREVGMRWGVIAGVVVVALFVVIYYLNREFVLDRKLWLGSTVFYLFAMYQAQKPVVSDDIKEYIQPGFMTFVIANAIFYIFYHLLFTQIDPGLLDVQAQLLESQGYLDDAGGREGLEPTFSKTFFDYTRSLIVGFVLAAAIGFGLKLQNR